MDEKFPFILYLSPIILGTIGVIMIASASSGEIIGYSVISSKFLKQLLIFLICIPLYLLILKIRPEFWIKARYFIIIIAVLSLILVHFFGITINNSTRWLKIFNFTLEPTIFCHLALIIFISGEKRLLPSIISIFTIALLIFLQPDLSSAFITILLGSVMLLIRGYKIPRFAYFLFILILIPFFFPRQINKFVVRSKSFYLGNIQNTTSSLRKGGIFGMGLGEGIDKFSSIPLPYSDNIFATGAQELGFMWGILVIILFLMYYINSLTIIRKCSSHNIKSLGFGASTIIATYALLNIFSSINIIPITGDPLPFISHGGSSLIFFYITAGIIGGIANESNDSRWWNGRSYNTRN